MKYFLHLHQDGTYLSNSNRNHSNPDLTTVLESHTDECQLNEVEFAQIHQMQPKGHSDRYRPHDLQLMDKIGKKVAKNDFHTLKGEDNLFQADLYTTKTGKHVKKNDRPGGKNETDNVLEDTDQNPWVSQKEAMMQPCSKNNAQGRNQDFSANNCHRNPHHTRQDNTKYKIDNYESSFPCVAQNTRGDGKSDSMKLDIGQQHTAPDNKSSSYRKTLARSDTIDLSSLEDLPTTAQTTVQHRPGDAESRTRKMDVLQPDVQITI